MSCRSGRIGCARASPLDLRFLINTQYNCVFRWVEVQPHDVFQLLLKGRIIAAAKALDLVRLQVVGLQNLMNLSVADAYLRSAEKVTTCFAAASIDRK